MAATVGATLSGVTFALRHAGEGPYQSSGGNYYFFGRDSVNTGNVEPHKASDPMSAFTAQTAKTMSSATSTAIEAMACYQNGNTIYVFTQISTGAVYFNAYTMDTDTWGLVTSATTIAAAGFAPTANATSVSAAYRPTAGELVLGYCAGLTAMSSGFNMVRYARVNVSTGAVIGSVANIDNGGSVDWRGPIAMLGASDRVHFFFVSGTAFDAYQRTLTAANALQTFPAAFETNLYGVATNSIGRGVSYTDGGTTRVVVPYQVTNTPLAAAARMDSSDAPSVSTATAGDATMRQSAQSLPYFDMAVNGTTPHLLYTRSSDADLYHDSSADNGATWGVDVNELASAGVNLITSNVYSRSGTTRLASVIDNAGTIQYIEIDLAAAAVEEANIYYSPVTVLAY